MNLKAQKYGALTIRALRQAGLLNQAVVVLIGSYARNVETWRSDVDILVLLQQPLCPRLNIPDDVHLHFEDKEKFARRFVEGDDYAISSVKYGKLLHDESNFWGTLKQQLKNVKWPEWRDKISHAERRLKVGDELLEMGDIDAAIEEYLFGATQISRAILLKRGIYPLSRPELSGQLISIGQADLATQILALIRGKCEGVDLRKVSHNLTMTLKQELARA